MEKLLHERLREHVDGFRFDLGGGMNLALSQPQAIALADKIERCYIPRPRFEDGEPIQWGDEFYNGCGSTELYNFQVDECGVYHLDDYVEDPEITLSKGEFVKRPTPKVLDADGVEIKVGDTVYEFDDGTKCEVLKLHESEPRITVRQLDTDKDVSGGWFLANGYSHERPVFDADGVRIRKGDTVWHVNGTLKWIVKEIRNGKIATVSDECQTMTAWRDPQELTHREPDSLEKLRDDMDEYLNLAHEEAGIKNTSPLDCWVDRLTALIERGA